MNGNYVIIGCGNAGLKAALEIRKYDNVASIILITDEEYPPYCRCLLTYYIEDKVDEDFLFNYNSELLEMKNIKLLKNRKVIGINLKSKYIFTENNENIYYEKLLIATGGVPEKPAFEYDERSNVFTLRKFSDAAKIKSTFKKGDYAVIEGGGLVSLKTLLALYEKGVQPVWIVKSDYILSFIIDLQCANLIKNILSEKNIKIFTRESIKLVSKNNDNVIVETDKGKRFEAKGVVVGKGVKSYPISEEFDFNRGYVVNEFLETDFKDVYAAGDCIICNDVAHEKKWKIPLWPHAGEQGIIAGRNMVFGNRVAYKGTIPVNSFSIFDNYIITGGKKKIFENEKNFFTEKVETKGKTFKKFIYNRAGVLKGYFLMNDLKNGGKYFYEVLRDNGGCHERIIG